MPDRFEEKQEARPIRPAGRSPYGQIVTKPLEETLIEDFTYITRQPVKEGSELFCYAVFTSLFLYISLDYYLY